MIQEISCSCLKPVEKDSVITNVCHACERKEDGTQSMDLLSLEKALLRHFLRKEKGSR